MTTSGPARSNNRHNFNDNNAIAKYKDRDALPNTSIARSKICTRKIPSSTFRKITPPASAQTNVGNSNTVPLLKIGHEVRKC